MTPALSAGARIGITGSRGVLGSRIASACSHAGLLPVGYDGDVRDSEYLLTWVRSLDAVVHSAAVVPVTAVESDLATAVGVNVGGTAAVARAAAQGGLPLAYVSSSHVYEPSPSPLTELSPLRPSSRYGLTKLHGEAWCQALHEGPLLLRVFSFFDARQAEPYLVPTLLRRVAEAPPGAELGVHSAASTRDLADARWMAQAIVSLLLAGVEGAVNVAVGVGVSVGQVAQAASRALRRPDIRWHDATPGRSDHLVADTRHVRSLVSDLPAFDLDSAMREAAGV